MSIEIKIPSPGESITQVQLSRWLVGDGAVVEQDQELAEIDSDKATFPISAPVSGRIVFHAAEGDTLPVGALIAVLEPEEVARASSLPATPLARRIISGRKMDEAALAKAAGGRKITRKDVENYLRGEKTPDAGNASAPAPVGPGSRITRQKLSTLRQKLAERLVAVKNETAMLTTFNEVNMAPVIALRDKYDASMKEQYGPGPGFVSYFAKAATIALQEFPAVNSMIDGDELLTPEFVEIGVAVSAPKGLVVPVIRNTETLSVFVIEEKLRGLAGKARENRISIDEMKGGTFTISNGGVFGSLMSTPILNPPQSAILGMHKIQDRPVAVNGRVLILPMMYVALSYDHRVIDGRESVGFLLRIKELLETPEELLKGGTEMEKRLLEQL